MKMSRTLHFKLWVAFLSSTIGCMAVGGLLYWHQQAYCEPDLVKRRRELLEKDPALRKRVELDEARRKLIMEHYGLDNRMGGKPM